MTFKALGSLPEIIRAREADLASLPLRRSAMALREQLLVFGRTFADEPGLFLFGLKMCERISEAAKDRRALSQELGNLSNYQEFILTEVHRICTHYGIPRDDERVRQCERLIRQHFLIVKLRIQELTAWESRPVRWLPVKTSVLQGRLQSELIQIGGTPQTQVGRGLSFTPQNEVGPLVEFDFSHLHEESIVVPERLVEMVSDLCQYLWIAGEKSASYQIVFCSAWHRITLLLSVEGQAVEPFERLFSIQGEEGQVLNSPRNHLYRFVMVALTHHGCPELATSEQLGSHLRLDLAYMHSQSQEMDKSLGDPPAAL